MSHHFASIVRISVDYRLRANINKGLSIKRSYLKGALMLLASCFILGNLQAQKERALRDSIKYYQKEMSLVMKAHRDSLNSDENFIEIKNNLQRLTSTSDNYFAFTLYTNLASADFAAFNNANVQSNFPKMQGNMVGIGYGFSFKKNRRVFDLNMFTVGIPKKIKKDPEEIKTSLSAFLQFEWGYDLIKHQSLNIYPFLGIGLRASNLSYEGPSVTNSNFSNVSTLVQNNRDVNEGVMELGYQAGLGVEYALSRKSSGGIIIFAKAGTNNAFKRKQFKIEGLSYDPKFNFGEKSLSIGFKFFGRS